MTAQSTALSTSVASPTAEAIPVPVAPAVRHAARRRAVTARLGERRGHGPGEMILRVGIAAVAVPVALVLMGLIALMAVVLAGPFLLGGILAIAFAVVVFGAVGAVG